MSGVKPCILICESTRDFSEREVISDIFMESCWSWKCINYLKKKKSNWFFMCLNLVLVVQATTYMSFKWLLNPTWRLIYRFHTLWYLFLAPLLKTPFNFFLSFLREVELKKCPFQRWTIRFKEKLLAKYLT